MNRPFRIVTHRNWLAEQFAPFGAVQDFGFDIDPTTARDTLWWAPGAWVASALKAGVRLPLLSCGPHWQVPQMGRRVATGRLDQLHSPAVGFGDRVFVKVAEAKVESFPAQIFENNRHLADTLAQFHLPGDTILQVQEPVDFFAEARFFIAHGQIVASSIYRIYGLIWGAAAWPDGLTGARRDALELLTRFARDVVASAPQPPGWVLDVGLTPDGQRLVVEANAAWSSAPYDADPAGVVRAITAAHDFAGEHPGWAWEPNPVLAGVGPLRLAGAVR